MLDSFSTVIPPHSLSSRPLLLCSFPVLAKRGGFVLKWTRDLVWLKSSVIIPRLLECAISSHYGQDCHFYCKFILVRCEVVKTLLLQPLLLQ